jgi:ribonuclease E
MTKRMLIDATHAEETRVVVLDGNRLEDFDVETSTKKQIKGNIYLAKVIRVEPSLQAAFVEYGGNRHGFLAFSEIHPDYYQIPVADRQRLIEAELAEAQSEEDAEAAEDAAQERAASGGRAPAAPAHPITSEFDAFEPAFEAAVASDQEDDASHHPLTSEGPELGPELAPELGPELAAEETAPRPRTQAMEMVREIVIASEPPAEDAVAEAGFIASPEPAEETSSDEDAPETLGGTDPTEENGARRAPPRFVRNYKIQEVIHRRQIMLIQVVKEERGTKGAALTTYLSLAGRYCVLMPNSPRGGGVSRKITSVSDRKRLREVIREVDMPRGMGLIVRTAGANRPKPEIRRDCEYLLRLWDDIREHTLKSVAPSLIYEEASLIKRAIRDGYTRDIEEVLVDGEDGWRAARDFMRMLTPQHAAKVQLWRGSDTPLFAKHQVELQLDAMLSPTVQLKSGGYLVIDQTEALVAIDVNSGRSTRERNIEETALRTNLEAADEAARQLRLRDLAGLIVIDFIDMESRKHNGMVERRLKDALKNDRARIQVGTISHFGLMEMSRQRLRPSLNETSFITCPHCLGTGTVRSVESSAIHVLRAIEDEGARRRSAEIHVYVAGAVAMYILNQKRDRLMAIERTHGMQVILLADDKLVPPQIRVEKIRPYVAAEAPAGLGAPIAMDYADREDAETDEDDGAMVAPQLAETIAAGAGVAAEMSGPPAGGADAARGEESSGRRRRRRRRRGGRREENGDTLFQVAENGEGSEEGEAETDGVIEAADPTPAPQEPAVPPVPMPVPGPETPDEPGRGPELPPPNGPEPELPGLPGEPGPEIMPPIGPSPEMPQPVAFGDGESEGRSRGRRGRRGGRGRSGRGSEAEPIPVAPAAPAYRGPTPADPYYGQIDALFAVFDPDAESDLAGPRVSVPEASLPIEAAAIEAPVVEAPVVKAPVVESPVIEALAPETPPVERPAEPVNEAVPVELPAKPARAPRARKPKVAAPVADEAEVVVAEPEAKPARRRAPPRAKATATAAAETAAQAEVTAMTPASVEAPHDVAASAPALPAITPMVIGVDAPVVSKRQGWWKR